MGKSKGDVLYRADTRANDLHGPRHVLSCYMTSSEYKALIERAAAEGRSLSETARRLLSEKLAEIE